MRPSPFAGGLSISTTDVEKKSTGTQRSPAAPKQTSPKSTSSYTTRVPASPSGSAAKGYRDDEREAGARSSGIYAPIPTSPAGSGITITPVSAFRMADTMGKVVDASTSASRKTSNATPTSSSSHSTVIPEGRKSSIASAITALEGGRRSSGFASVRIISTTVTSPTAASSGNGNATQVLSATRPSSSSQPGEAVPAPGPVPSPAPGPPQINVKEAVFDNIRHGREGPLDALLTRGNASLRVTDRDGWTTPIMAAVQEGRPRILRLLLASGLDFDRGAVDAHGRDALLLAIIKANGLRSLSDTEGPEACALLLIEHAGMPLETEDHDGWRPLPLAAFYGLEACTRALVKQGARTDVVTKSGDGVLACSVYKTGAEGARVLSFLVREVRLKDDKANKQQETALHIAARYSPMDPELATLLVTEAASHINARTVNGSTPLYIAASYHNHEADPKALLIKRLLQLGAHPALPVKEAQDSVPRYPLDVLKLVAIDARDALTVTCAATVGSGTTAPTSPGQVPSSPVGKQVEDVMALLKENPLRVHERNKDLRTPIHLACAWKRLPVLTQLLAEFRVWYSAQPFAQQFPLDLDTQDRDGNTALHLVMKSDGTGQGGLATAADVNAIVTRLIEAGAHPAPETSTQRAPIHGFTHWNEAKTPLQATCIATRKGKVDEVRSLVTANPKRLLEQEEGSSLDPMAIAVDTGQAELVRLLGPLCIDRVDAPRGSRRRTLLRMACEAGRTEVAAILVDELGVDIGLVSGPDSDRKTPMQAAQSNRPKTDDIVRLLTAACTAAKEGKAQEVQRLVDKNRKRLQEQDEDGTNVFWLTVASPHFESYRTKIRLLKWLVQAGIETHIFDTKGVHPLHSAISAGAVPVLRYLLRLYPLEKAGRLDGMTPLHLAVDAGRRKMVRFLLEDLALDHSPVRESDGLTPLELARSKLPTADMAGIIALLEEFVKDRQWTTLHVAAYRGRLDKVKAIVAKPPPLWAERPHGLGEREFGEGTGNLGTFGTHGTHDASTSEKKKTAKTFAGFASTTSRGALASPHGLRAPSEKTIGEHSEAMGEGGLAGENEGTLRMREEEGQKARRALLFALTAAQETAVYKAAIMGHADVVVYLLEQMGEAELVNSKDVNKRKHVTLLYAAAANGHVQVVDLLLRRFGADPSIGKGVVTPFRIAVNQQDKHPELRDLLDPFADDEPWPKAHVFANLGECQSLQAILAADAQAAYHRTQTRGEVPLHKAATRGHAEAVDLLLQLHQQKRPTSTGAQVGMEDGMVNVRNNFQETPLFKACLHARVDVVRTLVQRYGADPSIRDVAQGRTPLEAVNGQGPEHEEIRRILAGFDHDEGWLPVHVLSFLGAIGPLRELIERTSDAASTDGQDGKVAVARLLAERTSGLKETCLHKAARGGREEALLVLLWNHANPRLVNKNDETAEHLARDLPTSDADRLGEMLAVAAKRPLPPSLIIVPSSPVERTGLTSPLSDDLTSALSGSLPLAERGADEAMGKDDDTVTYFNSAEDDQTRPDVGKADEASGMVAKMGLTKFLSKKVPPKKFEDPKGQEPAPMPVEEEEVEAFDFKAELDNQATAIADRIHSSMTSIRKLPNIPTLGDILLSFVQKYAAVSSVRIKWPRIWVLSVAWLRITFAGWETLFDFPDNGAVYWVGFTVTLLLPLSMLYFLLLDPNFFEAKRAPDDPFTKIASSWVDRYMDRWPTTRRRMLLLPLPALAGLLLSLWLDIIWVAAACAVCIGISCLHYAYVALVQRQIYIISISVIGSDHMIPPEQKRAAAFQRVRELSCNVYLFLVLVFYSVTTKMIAENLMPGKSVTQKVVSALLFLPCVVVPIFSLVAVSHLAVLFVKYHVQKDKAASQALDAGAGIDIVIAPASDEVKEPPTSAPALLLPFVRVCRRLTQSLPTSQTEADFSATVKRLLESDDVCGEGVRALLRKLSSFEHRAFWYPAYMVAERALMVLAVTLPYGRGADVLQLTLALALESLGTSLSAWKQPFLQHDEDLSNLVARSVNMACILIGILLEAGKIQELWAQAVLSAFSAVFIGQFIWALYKGEVVQSARNIRTLALFQGRYGAYDPDQVEKLAAADVQAMDSYALSYGWDARRQLLLLRKHWIVGKKLNEHLRTFKLNGGYIGGRMTGHFGVMYHLETLDLSCNGFSGRIPEALGNLRQLRVLNLSTNYLEDTVPEALAKLVKLEKLDLSMNHLTGIVPKGIFLLPNLRLLNLAYNHFEGEMPPIGPVGEGRRQSLVIEIAQTSIKDPSRRLATFAHHRTDGAAALLSPMGARIEYNRRQAEVALGQWVNERGRAEARLRATLKFTRMVGLHLMWLVGALVLPLLPLLLLPLTLTSGLLTLLRAAQHKSYDETPALLRDMFMRHVRPTLFSALGLSPSGEEPKKVEVPQPAPVASLRRGSMGGAGRRRSSVVKGAAAVGATASGAVGTAAEEAGDGKAQKAAASGDPAFKRTLSGKGVGKLEKSGSVLGGRVWGVVTVKRKFGKVVPHGETEGAAPVEKDEDSEDSDFYADE